MCTHVPILSRMQLNRRSFFEEKVDLTGSRSGCSERDIWVFFEPFSAFTEAVYAARTCVRTCLLAYVLIYTFILFRFFEFHFWPYSTAVHCVSLSVSATQPAKVRMYYRHSLYAFSCVQTNVQCGSLRDYVTQKSRSLLFSENRLFLLIYC